MAGPIRPSKKVRVGKALATPACSDLDSLNEVIMKAQGKPFKKGETEPLTDLVTAMFHTLIEQVRNSFSSTAVGGARALYSQLLVPIIAADGSALQGRS